MKRSFIILPGFLLLALVFTSCSAVTGALGDNEALYKAVIERYCNSTIQANIDDYINSLDPSSPMYPSDEDIEGLRAIADEIGFPGGALVRDMTVLEESTDRAQIKAELILRIDFYKNGNFQQQTGNLTFELTLRDGEWRIFDVIAE